MDGSENMDEKQKNGNGVSDAFNLIDASALSKVKDKQKLNYILHCVINLWFHFYAPEVHYYVRSFFFL